jgi:hypothetical protein
MFEEAAAVGRYGDAAHERNYALEAHFIQANITIISFHFSDSTFHASTLPRFNDSTNPWPAKALASAWWFGDSSLKENQDRWLHAARTAECQ